LVFLYNSGVGWALLGTLWFLTFCGIGLTISAFDHLPKWVPFTMFITMGWMGALLAVAIYPMVGVGGIALVAIGGVAYSVRASLRCGRGCAADACMSCVCCLTCVWPCHVPGGWVGVSSGGAEPAAGTLRLPRGARGRRSPRADARALCAKCSPPAADGVCTHAQIWHVAVIVGALFHYLFMWFYVLPWASPMA
jgi:predicted membrane channel-forming protein YqfA (hemolysin III family)